MLTMNLDEQIRDLIEDAPQDGTTPALVEAIAPILKQLAAQLRHLQYYVIQSLDRSWVVNVLEQPSQPGVEKQVIYAFATLKDVGTGPISVKDPQMIALPVPVTHILFQLLALNGIDSMIFFEVPGNVATGTEIRRSDLQALVQAQLQTEIVPPSIPPDIA